MRNRLIAVGVLLGAVVLNACQPIGGGIVEKMVDKKTPLVMKGEKYSIRLVPDPVAQHDNGFGHGSSHYLIWDNKGGKKHKAKSLLNVDQIWSNLMEQSFEGKEVTKEVLKRFGETVDILSSENGETLVIRESVENDDDGPVGDFILVQLGKKQGAYRVKLPEGMYRKNPVTDQMWKDDREAAQKIYNEWLSTDYTPRLLLLTNEELHVEHWTGKAMVLKIAGIKGAPAWNE